MFPTFKVLLLTLVISWTLVSIICRRRLNWWEWLPEERCHRFASRSCCRRCPSVWQGQESQSPKTALATPGGCVSYSAFLKCLWWSQQCCLMQRYLATDGLNSRWVSYLKNPSSTARLAGAYSWGQRLECAGSCQFLFLTSWPNRFPWKFGEMKHQCGGRPLSS